MKGILRCWGTTTTTTTSSSILSPMENGGEEPKSTSRTTTTPDSSDHQRTTTSKRGPVPGPQYHHKHHLLPLLPLLISSTSLIDSFLSENDLRLHPSQALTLESKLSSITLKINRLKSVIQNQQQQNPNSTPKTLKSTRSQSKKVESPTPLVRDFTTPPPQSPTPSPEVENIVFVPSSSCWFHRFLSDAYDQSDPRWIEAFSMTKTSFILLLQTLAPSLPENSNISPDYMLASALFRLAHGASFKSVGKRFGIDTPATIRAFYEVIRAINDRLGHTFDFSPNDLSKIIVGFGWISLPNCCGVLGFSRFGFELAGNSGGDDAILVQCLVDSEGRFLDVSAGWPSSMNPSAILNHSTLYSRVEESKEFLNGTTFDFRDGSSIPQYILGDSCCPLLPWLLTPIPMVNDGGGDNGAQVYNSVHKKGMKLVDTAFRTVRARWRLLSIKWEAESIEPYPYVIVAGCLLHNFLLSCSEQLPEFMGEYDVEQDQFPVFEGKNDENALRIRYTLASQLVMASQSV